ncbi:hypothetical protein [Aestuariivirga sp.]|uniref:hypothetical protein n=1 Tax=Aestuariivirga sp. TaxID=2650926 RepID=UPI003BAB31FC
MKRILVASLLSLGLVAPIIPAQAAPTAAAPQQAMGPSELLQNAASGSKYNNNHRQMRKSWDRKRDGNRCRARSNSCRHYHNGYWYQSAWWTLPLLGGAVILNLDNKHTNRNRNHY